MGSGARQEECRNPLRLVREGVLQRVRLLPQPDRIFGGIRDLGFKRRIQTHHRDARHIVRVEVRVTSVNVVEFVV